MNILVTGCMGFIASHTIPKLLNDGHCVLGLDNLSKPSIQPTDRMKMLAKENWHNFSFHKVDINNLDQVINAVAAWGKKVDVIIHLAAVGSVPLSFISPQKTLLTNVIGFTNIYQLTTILDVKNFIYASSSSVYGDSDLVVRTEHQVGMPLSPYALSKQVNEMLVGLLAKHDVKTVGLRFFNVYGPGQSLNGNYTPVIPRFILDETPEVYGDGETTRDFTYVDDVADSILLSINGPSGVYNVGAGNNISLNVLLTLLGKIDKAKYLPFRYGDVKHSKANTQLAYKMLGFKAKTGINVGIEKTKEFYQSITV